MTTKDVSNHEILVEVKGLKKVIQESVHGLQEQVSDTQEQIAIIVEHGAIKEDLKSFVTKEDLKKDLKAQENRLIDYMESFVKPWKDMVAEQSALRLAHKRHNKRIERLEGFHGVVS